MDNNPGEAFSKLMRIVDTLMGENGCPWDRVQTRESLKPYLVEESYETLDALDSNNPEKIKDELGDLLYQILFHSKISENLNEFGISEVIENLSEKMVRRHPHVFAKEKLETPDEVIEQWEDIKKKEKTNKDNPSILDNVPKNLPSLARAQKLQKKAAKQGFDWDRIDDVLEKLNEEINEFKEALKRDNNKEITEEFGDLLFVLVNIGRFKKIDAEEALRLTNKKFIQRFKYIEQKVKSSGKTLTETPLGQMEEYWQEAKKINE